MKTQILLAATATSAALFAPVANAQVPTNIPGFGALTPTASENTGEVLLELPPEFKYTILIRDGEIMSDGNTSPGRADGMGAFANGNLVRLIRNHENSGGALIGGDPLLAYDPDVAGGTTTLDVDPTTRLLVNSFTSLHGTVRNCAGGVTPWGSWITCEETTAYNSTLDIQHGYNFEVPASANSLIDGSAARLTNLGLVYPEAIAVDPVDSAVYITMDRGPGGMFRFVPDTYGDLQGSGKLQMLAIEGLPQFNAGLNAELGKKYMVQWVDVTSPTDELAYRTNGSGRLAYFEGLGKGGTTFDRPEGIWTGRGSIFFACTDGGPIDKGQIYELKLRKNKQELTMIYAPTDENVMESPDNLCVTPKGNNLIICEDGGNGEFLHFLRTSGNQVYRLAKNAVPGFEGSEWAGACFSPDGKTLFANLQSPSMTFAIWTDNWGTINN